VKTYFECLPCMVRQALEGARHATDDEAIHEEVLRRFLDIAARADLSRPTPLLIGMVHRIIRDITGNPDPYRGAKDHFNSTAFSLYPQFKARVEASPDPVEAALRLANAGNCLDMIVDANLESADIQGAMEELMTLPVPPDVVTHFKMLTERARTILYLGDNAGEIVFDRLLIEQLPRDKITYAVRGFPVINDVTLVDARTIGMTDVVPVVDNGSDMPGTILEECSAEFRERFHRADLIISKGQGNYEAISDAEANIFFIFRAKCEVITLHLGYPVGSPVFLVNTRR
jgi:uncharacterized protein with ATP-grasp and redox domains